MDLTVNAKADFEQIKTTINNIIKSTIDDSKLFLSTDSIANLSVHLSIAILRLRSNNYIPLSNSQLASYKHDTSYPYAKMLCNRLAMEFEISFPDAEVSLVSMYLSKNQKLDLEINSGFDLLDDNIYQILQETMNNIYIEYHKDYRHDDKLFIALGLHLEPAIDRLLNDQTVENPLKDKIIERHKEEFELSKMINQIIFSRYQKSFNDDELAFITLHFVLANNRID